MHHGNKSLRYKGISHVFFGCGLCGATQGAATPTSHKLTMTITGEIAKSSNGYIVRGQMPPEVYTVMNPDPGVLDELATRAQVITVEVQVVSGENVAITKIDGTPYDKKIQ